MLPIQPMLNNGSPCRILCIGAHCDDIEIGCGGTILRLCEEHPNVAFHWWVLCSNETRQQECRSSAAAFLEGAKVRDVRIDTFRDGYLPYLGGQVKDAFEALKRQYEPDIVLTHCRCDLHQDHRLINELTWNTFRDHLILEYEIPKYDGDLGRPTLYVPLSEDHSRRKVELLLAHYRSQRSRRWFCEETFRGMMRVRGVESGASSGWAEGFHAHKLIW